jgi:hypothetical protein
MSIRRSGGQKAPRGKDPLEGAGDGCYHKVGTLGGQKGAYGPGGQGAMEPKIPADDSRTHPPEVEPVDGDMGEM